MESYNLKPRYTTNEIPGKCVKCLAEQELNTCLMALLREGEDENDEEIMKKFEALVTFLKSPESQKLRDESEKYLADGKKVNVKIYFKNGKPEYKLEIT